MPLKNKSAESVAAALKAWLAELNQAEEGGKRPKRKRYLFTDRGLEFTNRRVRELLQEHGVQSDFSQRGSNKAAIAERANKTIQLRIYKYLTQKGTTRYLEQLPQLVEGYNSARHRTLEGFTPHQADEARNEVEVREVHGARFAKIERKGRRVGRRSRLGVGDLVLVKVEGKSRVGQHTRAYTPNFKSDELFVVVKVNKRMPVPMYKVSSLKTGLEARGSYYPSELTKVVRRKFKVAKFLRNRRSADGGLERLARFEGLHPAFDTWIDPEKDLDRERKVKASSLSTPPTVQNLRRLLENE